MGSNWEATTQRVQEYEQSALDLIATGDHMRHPFDAGYELLDGWSVVPAWAAVTSRLRISVLVTNIIYRSPMLTARQVAAVDQISRGRLDVGIGTGIFETDHAMAGVLPVWTPRERIARLEEFVRAYLALLGGAESFDGRWYSFSDGALAPPPLQQPRPPLVIAANGAHAIEVAAKYGDGWNTWGGYGINEDEFFALAAARSRRFTDCCLRHGRDPDEPVRSILVHHAAVDAWESRDKFTKVVRRCAAAGFSELIFYEPRPERQRAFNDVVANVMPDLQSIT